MKLDTLLVGEPTTIRARAEALAAAGVDGLYTFEGPWDVFTPLVLAADALAGQCDLYTNVAIAFPRSPMHLAQQANDLQSLSRGRFALGLGTQVRAHVERRFGSTWGRPVEHLREWVDAVRAIQDHWQDGTPLAFGGEYTTHTKSAPMFDPGPNPNGPPPVWLGALGPRMTDLACEIADAVLVHPFASRRHLHEVSLPRLAAGGARQVVGQAIVGVGNRSVEAVRGLLAFYGSTPAYRPVLDTHGWGDLQPRLQQLTRRGEWDRLPALVDDEVVRTIAVVGTPDEIAAELVARFAGHADRVAMYSPAGFEPDAVADVVTAFRAALPG